MHPIKFRAWGRPCRGRRWLGRRSRGRRSWKGEEDGVEDGGEVVGEAGIEDREEAFEVVNDEDKEGRDVEDAAEKLPEEEEGAPERAEGAVDRDDKATVAGVGDGEFGRDEGIQDGPDEGGDGDEGLRDGLRQVEKKMVI